MGRDSKKCQEGHGHIATFKMDNQRRPIVSTGNAAQGYVPAWMGEGFGREWMHVRVCLGPFAVHPKLPQHC